MTVYILFRIDFEFPYDHDRIFLGAFASKEGAIEAAKKNARRKTLYFMMEEDDLISFECGSRKYEISIDTLNP